MNAISLEKIMPVLLSIIIVTGCQESNPLNQKPINEVATLLMDASKSASLSAGFDNSEPEDNYRQCMRKEAFNSTCSDLIKAMCAYVSKKGVHLTPSQLTDKHMYNRVAERLDFLSHLID